MPTKAKKPCGYPGCRELTSNRYCASHTKEITKHYNKYQRHPESNKRYGRSWKKTRAAFLLANPLCAICWKGNRLTAADTVHHIKPLAEGGTNQPSNLQALCHSCHSKLHAKSGDYF